MGLTEQRNLDRELLLVALTSIHPMCIDAALRAIEHPEDLEVVIEKASQLEESGQF